MCRYDAAVAAFRPHSVGSADGCRSDDGYRTTDNSASAAVGVFSLRRKASGRSSKLTHVPAEVLPSCTNGAGVSGRLSIPRWAREVYDGLSTNQPYPLRGARP